MAEGSDLLKKAIPNSNSTRIAVAAPCLKERAFQRISPAGKVITRNVTRSRVKKIHSLPAKCLLVAPLSNRGMFKKKIGSSKLLGGKGKVIVPLVTQRTDQIPSEATIVR